MNKRISFFKKRPGICFIVVLIIAIAITGLFWLSTIIFLLTIIYRIVRYGCDHIKSNWVKNTVKNIILLVYVVVISAGVKLFLIDIYRINRGSMEETFFSGDVIMINKLTYGPVISSSPFGISWIKRLFTGNLNGLKISNESYIKLKGLSAIQQGDLLVYELKDTFFVVKRCVAIAGDTLAIVNGEIYTNGKKYISPQTIKNMYQLTTTNASLLIQTIDSMKGNNKDYLHNAGFDTFWGSFTRQEIENLTNCPGLKAKRISDMFNESRNVFIRPNIFNWTMDSMGPLVVPKKGMSIQLTDENLAIYEKALEIFEEVAVSRKNGNFYIEGEMAQIYTFKKNYYFMMGDNRPESLDSRVTGFIPEERIIGKYQLILFSNHNK